MVAGSICNEDGDGCWIWVFDCFISLLPGNSFDSVTANDAALDGAAAD